ncbi:hypothetical protein CEE37_01040 [candidate division LCP-89 bacterium B3_LCP]|uniref:SbsA Ig-like domain-containing protein n=1 Tax=candidate division LCP-89 bacterium B3_LCP TaxID=2012998 RepID=A0A532V511_UNCL8|nr:MAG: hypothetical protein CEE37_01040 [candidate division LCP-89 bacterium B3_LCP]
MLIEGCARQAPPPGGPVDVTGPVVTSSYPEPEVSEVPLDISPWIRFDEWILSGSVEGSIFISPHLESGFAVKTSGKKIKIVFNEELPPDRTIVVTFGSGIKDSNGNQMSESFVLAFSTGQSIDRAGIQGRVKGVIDPASAWIWAYPLVDSLPPDPSTEKALFAVQPDLQGFFTLSFLPQGWYRVFGIEETSKDRIWDAQSESFAISDRDLYAEEDSFPFTNLMFNRYDNEPPHLRDAVSIHRQGMRFSFSEPVEISDVEVSIVSYKDRPLPVINEYKDQADSNAFYITTGMQQTGDIYRIVLNGLSDENGNIADSISAEVETSTSVDTVGPSLTWSYPGNGMRDVSLDTPVKVGFSEAVTLTDLPKAVQILDSDSIMINGSWHYQGASWGTFLPDTLFAENSSYQIHVHPDSIRDIFGNRSSDSLAIMNFTTHDTEKFGSISGNVTGTFETPHIVAEGIDGVGLYESAVDHDGAFHLTQLIAANYRLWLYEDLDGNHIFTPGKLDPFTYSEPFQVFDDTVRVRSRWETEAVTLHWHPNRIKMEE